MKRILSIALILVMSLAVLFSFSACSEEGLEGSWKGELDITALLNGEIDDEAMKEYIQLPELKLDYILTFNADGSFFTKADEAQVRALYEKAKEAFKKGATAYLQAGIDEGGGGVTVDELLALAGYTLDSLADSIFGEENLQALLKTFAMEGRYKQEGEKLYFSAGANLEPGAEDYLIASLSGKKLTLEKDERGILAGLEPSRYPLVFKKMK